MMDQLDEKLTGYVSEMQFVQAVKRLYPAFQLSSILKFELIPPEALNEANMQTSVHNGSMMNMRRRVSCFFFFFCFLFYFKFKTIV